MSLVKTEYVESFFQTSDLSPEVIDRLFIRSSEIKKQFIQSRTFPQSLKTKQIALLFAEASTRTKISFQMAIQRMGGQCLIVDDASSSSMSKGESFADTFWTLHSFQPDLFIIRCGAQGNLKELAKMSQIPILSAGFAAESHPTQALLDAMTILEYRDSLKGEKVLFVGDIKHSRVVASLSLLLKDQGCEMGICGPDEFLPLDSSEFRTFKNLEEGLSWATIYYGLRVQKERHDSNISVLSNYHKDFGLNPQRLKSLSSEALIMHPGPVNWGMEFDPKVAADPRFVMWKQKENGVYLRAALLEYFIGGSQS